jgi:hypothetical protein
MPTRKEGVMIMKDGKGWGEVYTDGRSTVMGWVDIDKAAVYDARYCKKLSDVTYKGSPYAKELEAGKLVKVVRVIETFVVE